MKKVFFLSLSILCLSLFAIDSKAQCSGMNPQPGSDWAITGWGVVLSPDSTAVSVAPQICNMINATPSWSSSNYICTFDYQYRPYSTKTFTLYGGGGGSTILQGTVNNSGQFYVKYISGPVPGRTCPLSGGFYTK